jgi:hypothetical protein
MSKDVSDCVIIARILLNADKSKYQRYRLLYTFRWKKAREKGRILFIGVPGNSCILINRVAYYR